MGCIFCSIAKGEIASEKVYEDESVLAFKDVNPQAPVHFLVIPKDHIKSCNEITKENSSIISHIFTVIPIIAQKLRLQDGYRVVINFGESAGQTVMHMHFHVLGGRAMQWPPG